MNYAIPYHYITFHIHIDTDTYRTVKHSLQVSPSRESLEPAPEPPVAVTALSPLSPATGTRWGIP